MKKLTTFALVGGMILTGVGLSGCGKGGEETAAVANQETWTWLEATKEELDAKRAELAAARREVVEARVVVEDEEATEEAAEETADAVTTDEPAAPVESAADRVAALEAEIGDLSQEFGSRLVEYINALEIIDGEPLTADQQKAIRMKSDEDIELAGEWIEKGGDYRRAIDIYGQSLALDPDYQRLHDALAHAEKMRFPSEEHFAEVKKGMTQLEVRDILGPVNLHNVREYPEKNAVAWFYAKDPAVGKQPSAVYFQMGDDGYKVYQTDYGTDEAADDEDKEDK